MQIKGRYLKVDYKQPIKSNVQPRKTEDIKNENPWNGKVLIIVIAICIFIVGGIRVYFNNTKSSDWKEINSLKEYEELLNSPITEIRLRKTIDSAQWAVFTDSDLIEIWADYLHNLEVMRENRITKADKEVNGGIPVINIKTQNSEFTLVLRGVSGEYKFEIDGYFYAIKNPRDIPFSETYDTAVERHGTKSPWD